MPPLTWQPAQFCSKRIGAGRVDAERADAGLIASVGGGMTGSLGAAIWLRGSAWAEPMAGMVTAIAIPTAMTNKCLRLAAAEWRHLAASKQHRLVEVENMLNITALKTTATAK